VSEQGPRAGARDAAEPGGGRALLLGAAGLLMAPTLLPWGVLGLALEVAAVVLGVRTLRRALANGRVAPGARAAVVLGGVAAFLLVVLLGFLVAFYQEYEDYRACYDRAITISAQTRCRVTFEDALRERLGLPR
jgi:hypothetical protein